MWKYFSRLFVRKLRVGSHRAIISTCARVAIVVTYSLEHAWKTVYERAVLFFFEHASDANHVFLHAPVPSRLADCRLSPLWPLLGITRTCLIGANPWLVSKYDSKGGDTGPGRSVRIFVTAACLSRHVAWDACDTFPRDATLSYTTLPHTHTPLSYTDNFFTLFHNSDTHTQLTLTASSFTRNSFTHNSLTHTHMFHTPLS